MTEFQVKLENEKPLDSLLIYKVSFYDKSMINYLSGIEKFDKFLDGRKYAETKYQLHLINYNHFLSFQIFLESKMLCMFNLEKTSVKDVLLSKGQKIEVDTLGDKEYRGSGLALTFGLVGVITANVVGGLTNVMKKDKIFIKSIDYLNGSIYTIVLNDNEESKIVLTTLDQNFLIGVNAFFSKAFNFNFSGKFEYKPEKSKNCYLATLCYGDINATEVVAFRHYRDHVLSKSIFGKMLIKLYYKTSPTLVAKLKNRNSINSFIKTKILNRIYKRIK